MINLYFSFGPFQYEVLFMSIWRVIILQYYHHCIRHRSIKIQCASVYIFFVLH